MTKYFFTPSIRKLIGKERPGLGVRYVLWRYIGKFLVAGLGLFVLWFSLLWVLSQAYVLEMTLGLMPSQSLSGINVLVYGIDDTRRVQRSDTIILVHLSDSGDRLSALSIPRDTRLMVPGIGLTKVNHAYAHGGDALLKTAVSQFIDVPIHHSVKVNLSGVEKLIDAIGGVTVDVPKPLKYEDLAGNLSIDIPKGKQLLKGKDAVSYLRFRQDRQGDIGRIHRQQTFLKEMMDQTLSTGTFFRLPGIIWSLRQLIQSDLSMMEMAGLAKRFSGSMKAGKLKKSLVPGRVGVVKGVSYWLVDQETMAQTLSSDFFQVQSIMPTAPSVVSTRPTISEPEELLPDSFSGAATVIISQEELLPEQLVVSLPEILEPEPIPTQPKKRRSVKPTKKRINVPPKPIAKPTNPVPKQKSPAPTTQPAKKVPSKKPALPVNTQLSAVKKTIQRDLSAYNLQVEVLNGYGRAGEAGRAAALIRAQGLKIFKAQNSGRFDYTQTKLVDWKGNSAAAKDMARTFFIDPQNIVVYDKPTKPIDFTIVLGADWEDIKRKVGQ